MDGLTINRVTTRSTGGSGLPLNDTINVATGRGPPPGRNRPQTGRDETVRAVPADRRATRRPGRQAWRRSVRGKGVAPIRSQIPENSGLCALHKARQGLFPFAGRRGLGAACPTEQHSVTWSDQSAPHG